MVSRGVAEEAGEAKPERQAAAGGSQPGLESAGPEYRSATDAQQVELLRRLLGVQAPKPTPAVKQPGEAAQPAIQPEPTPVSEPVSAPADEPTPQQKPTSKSSSKRAPAAPKPKPAAAKPRAVTKPGKHSPAPLGEPTEAEAPETVPPAVGAAPAPLPAGKSAAVTSAANITSKDLPPIGTIINAENAERWSHLLTPSLRWNLAHGGRMEIGATIPIALEPPRAEATERYHSQVQLSKDKKGLVNYVAGLPFPQVTESDPDAAIKLMFNMENRLLIDDLDGRDFGCITGAIDTKTGVKVERNYRTEHFRRLYYNGRLIVDPKPLWKTPENLRYRESLGPLDEPFDLKGSGVSYSRYVDPARQDDSWLYFPQTKRVRRLSTAQRSEGVFGQDVDLDSYAGFAGNPAWFTWQILGKKTLLAPYHPKHVPVRWAAKPGDFMFDDTWEPRETYVIAARSLLAGYNFSLRIIYLDAESFLVPYTEVYDNDGQLWRAYVQQWNASTNKPMPYATEAVYPFPTSFLTGLTVFDMQQLHTTRCEFPIASATREESWYYWWGNKSGGTVPEDFDVAAFIQNGR